MKWLGVKIKRGVKISVLGLGVISLVGFAGSKQDNRTCSDVVVHIDNQFENHFVNKEDVLALITDNQSSLLIGRKQGELDLRKLESKLYANSFVEKAQVSRNLNGNLAIDIRQARPIARIIRRSGPDVYLSDKGKLLPVSPGYTARVLLVEGGEFSRMPLEELQEKESLHALHEMVSYIYADRFLKAQIAHVLINSRDEIRLYPQVGKQIIEFGKAEEIASKFRRLKVFYKQILPAKGWNSYEKVNLKYQNQIICE